MKTTNTEELKQNGDFAKTLVWYIQHANSTEEAEEHVRRFLSSLDKPTDKWKQSTPLQT